MLDHRPEVSTPPPNLGQEAHALLPTWGSRGGTSALELRPLGRGLRQSWCPRGQSALHGQSLTQLREDSPAFHLNPRLHVKPGLLPWR